MARLSDSGVLKLFLIHPSVTPTENIITHTPQLHSNTILVHKTYKTLQKSRIWSNMKSADTPSHHKWFGEIADNLEIVWRELGELCPSFLSIFHFCKCLQKWSRHLFERSNIGSEG